MKENENGKIRAKIDENRAVGNKSANLLCSVSQKVLANKDLSQTVGLALLSAVGFLASRIEDLISRFQSSTWRLERRPLKTFGISVAASIFNPKLSFLFLGCLELKKEEQSRATNWGLIRAID
ncbi:hypothetical protein M9H77_17704 [Catharanthus roseus]|uniref:Uncharacterized protein n=1 Tax=Catharanthus roseus TaxID=4058 RepID=A0ACC0B5D6_CATRO|nr:hypothetical protein M9H77_17704 [Catharanthus roseus]